MAVGGRAASCACHRRGLGPLNVRCIELHRYVPGGGVLVWRLCAPPTPRYGLVPHHDSMSVLLSDLAEMLGGEFVVERRGACDTCPGPR